MSTEKYVHGIGSDCESKTGENLNKELQSTTSDEETRKEDTTVSPTINSHTGSATDSIRNNPSEYIASLEKEVKDKTFHKEYKKSLHISHLFGITCNLIVMQFAISAMVTACAGLVFQQMFIQKEMDSLKTQLKEMRKQIDGRNYVRQDLWLNDVRHDLWLTDVRQDLWQCRSVNSTNKLKVSQNSESNYSILEFDNINSKFHSIWINLSMINDTVVGLQNRESIISSDLSYVNSNISDLKTVELPQLEKEIKSSKITSTTLETKLDYFTRNLAVINGTVKIQDYKHVKYHEMFLYGLIGGIIEACIILVIVANWNRRDKKEEITEKTNRLLDQRSICFISFHDGSQPFHRKLLCSAVPADISIIPHLVRQPDRDIPSSKVIFLFIDKNERNVILENLDDLGDTKLKTVEAAEKIGAVFVVYVKDEGSKHLPREDLYNKQMTAFTGHKGLKGLTAKNRSFSVYDNFTDYQKERIKNDVTKLLS